jgi:ABC-2 type transport system permease protein
MSSVLKEIKKAYKYREAIKLLGLKDLKLKYVGSSLGVFWSILEPLLIILVYSLVFPIILKANFTEWVLFFIAGLIPYRYFNKGVTNITSSLVEQRELLNKVKMPLEVVPFSKLFSDSISFIIESSIVVIVSLIFVRPTFFILLYPVLFLIELFMILGAGLFLCSYYPRFRDLSYILRVFFEAFFFLTPIVYRLSNIPEIYRRVYMFNPLARLMYVWQGIILYSSEAFIEYFPIMENIVILFLISVVILVLGYFKFINSKRKIMEEI